MGRGGAGGAIVRRQSIASTSSASCAGVNVSVPSTIGGHTNLWRSRRLANIIFRSKRGHYLKGLYWDGSGLCLTRGR
jgi:hypothetical protein